MTFLIDGYNLMFAVGLASKGTPAAQFERARGRFLDWLADGSGGRGAGLRVVFDALHAPAPSLETAHRGVRVRFAFRQTADDVIEELVAVEQKPAALTVVSNDLRVREAGRRAGCGVTSCEEFTDWLIAEELPAAGAPGAPDGDKPEPAADDLTELLRVFSQPKPRLSS